jgi:hypothetical protein
MRLIIFGLVNHTHPANSHLLDDAIVRDGLAEHLCQRFSANDGDRA